MLFNSIDFAIFVPIVFTLYWFVFNKNRREQNFLLLVASYIFYSWWNWKFLILIILSTIIDYIVGLGLEKEERKNVRKTFLFISIFFNLGMLGFFKYYNFFLENFTNIFSIFGQEIKLNSLNIILPVGISFYTFQTLSYSIDIYRKKIVATKDFISFAAFVTFFPQLVAGPIERASNLLPQFHNDRVFKYNEATNGMKQILWGLFKKIVIADNCARYANIIFEDYSVYPSSILIIGALFFTFQIYGDFSGYSDIAIGTSRLFGFNLMKNFSYPYFSRSIAEFWRRWHISLSSWFRDYIYIPLGGSKSSKFKHIRNTLILFLVSGLWHGANWKFIVWGGINALYILPSILMNSNRKNLDTVAKGKKFPTIKELLEILGTFSLVVFSWIFFRAENISHALSYIRSIFSMTILVRPRLSQTLGKVCLITIANIIIFVIIEWIGRNEEYAIENFGIKWPVIVRWGFYYVVVFLIYFMNGPAEAFIYFQF